MAIHYCPKCDSLCQEVECGLRYVCPNPHCDYWEYRRVVSLQNRKQIVPDQNAPACKYCEFPMVISSLEEGGITNYRCSVCYSTAQVKVQEETTKAVTVLQASWLLWACLMVVGVILILFLGAVLTKINAMEKRLTSVQLDLSMLQRTAERHSHDIEGLARDSASLENRLPLYREGIRVHAEMLVKLQKDMQKLKEKVEK